MKKILIILLMILSISLVACSDKYEKIYNKAIEVTEKAYKKEGKVGEVIIEKFYGEYNGVYVLNPYLKGYDGGYRGSEGFYKVENYRFSFGSEDNMAYAIYDNTFYGFNEAYELGLLTLDDIKEIYEIHCTPLLLEAKYAYYERYLSDFKDASYKDVKLEEEFLSCRSTGYIQTYDYALFKLSSEYIANDEINDVFEIGKMKFEFKNQNDIIYLVYNNQLYTLKEAYESFDFIKERINEIYVLNLENNVTSLSYEWLKEYYNEYYTNHFKSENVKITDVVGIYGTTIVVLVEPVNGISDNHEKIYQKGGLEFVLNGKYYDIEVIDLKENDIVRFDKSSSYLEKENYQDIWNKLFAN